MKIAIIGAGLTGLTVAYRLSQENHQITVLEKENFSGGLTAGFKQKGWQWSLEYFFHHLFTSDLAAQNLIQDLGLSDRLFYTRPKTSIFYQNIISQFDSPFSLLHFPYLTFPEKMRTGFITAYLKLTNNWQGWEKISAFDWLKKYYGEKAFNILWRPLLVGKFGQHAPTIPMSWFWARIKKRSTKLGYLEGGFQVLIDKLAEKIKENGGEIILEHDLHQIPGIKGAKFRELARAKRESASRRFNKIIITTPSQIFFPEIKAPEMRGALNLILILKKQFLTDGTYWLNINEPDFPFVAVVEHTNFVNPAHYGGNHILYVGGYYSQNHRYFRTTKEQIFAEFLPYLRSINPGFSQLSTISCHLSTNLYAQPIIPLNYSQTILPHRLPKNPQTPQIPQVYLANMSQIYPWDRGINYAIDLGEKIAELLKWQTP